MKLELLYLLTGLPGSGKSTLLKSLISYWSRVGINPYVVLNDYAGADFDALEVASAIGKENTSYLPGNCVCCDGLIQLRDALINRPQRTEPLSIIEANGSSDPVELLSHLAVIEHGLSQPFVITTIHARDWKTQLENQKIQIELIQCASAVYLTHTDLVQASDVEAIANEIRHLSGVSLPLYNNLDQFLHGFRNLLNPRVDFLEKSELGSSRHEKYHFSSCHLKIPEKIQQKKLKQFLESLPKGLIRVKGVCSLQDSDVKYHYFERLQDGSITLKKFSPKPRFGTSMIVVGQNVSSNAIEKHLLTYLENN